MTVNKYDGEWQDAPGYGVQTIAYIDPQTGRPTLRHNGDYYRVDDDGMVVAMDHDSLIRWLVDDLKLIKVGSMVGYYQWQRVHELAMKDRDSLGSGD
jgi:hypothetical protein